MTSLEKYTNAGIVPVAVINNEGHLRNLANLCMKYIPAVELTMRTDYALTALKILKTDYPDLAVGAATILNVDLAKKVLDTGTDLLISPGCTRELIDFCVDNNVQYIPGVSTPAELEYCLLKGFKLIKFFPAEVAGGIKWLKAIESVYKHTNVKFMPLGGVSLSNVRDYMSMSNVSVCGGSWICPNDLMVKEQWDEIEKRFKEVKNIIEENR